MKYYHGSPTANIEQLKPATSNHQKSLVYVSTNEVVATFYMVNINFYPYGFSKDSNIPVYTEYYKDALKDIYLNKTGYLYECEDIGFVDNPTNIRCAFTCEQPVPIKSCIVIEDIYNKLVEYERVGRLIIKHYEELNIEQLENIQEMIVSEILSEKLLTKTTDYSIFIKDRFPEAWEIAINETR